MNKEKLKNLTWKYFIWRKVAEIILITLLVLAVINTMIPFGKYICVEIGFLVDSEACLSHSFFTVGITFIFLILCCLILSAWVIFMPFSWWLKLNWEKAEEQAREKLRR